MWFWILKSDMENHTQTKYHTCTPSARQGVQRMKWIGRQIFKMNTGWLEIPVDSDWKNRMWDNQKRHGVDLIVQMTTESADLMWRPCVRPAERGSSHWQKISDYFLNWERKELQYLAFVAYGCNTTSAFQCLVCH